MVWVMRNRSTPGGGLLLRMGLTRRKRLLLVRQRCLLVLVVAVLEGRRAGSIRPPLLLLRVHRPGALLWPFSWPPGPQAGLDRWGRMPTRRSTQLSLLLLVRHCRCRRKVLLSLLRARLAIQGMLRRALRRWPWEGRPGLHEGCPLARSQQPGASGHLGSCRQYG